MLSLQGVIVDYGLTLGDLIGVLHEFFKKLGIDQLRELVFFFNL